MKLFGEFVGPERRYAVAKITNLGTLIVRHEVMDGCGFTVAVILDEEKLYFAITEKFCVAVTCKEILEYKKRRSR